MSTLKVNNLQVGQDSTATNNLTWFQPGSPDGTIRLGSGNAGSATTKFTFDKDGNLTCVGNINAASILAPIEGTLDDWIVHAGDTNTKFGFPAADTFSVETAGQQNVQVNGTRVLLKSPAGTNTTVRLQHQGNSGYGEIALDRAVNAFVIDNDPSNASNNQSYFAVKNKGAINFYIKHDGKIGLGGVTSPEEILDLGESNKQNLKFGQRGYLGQAHSTTATILGHCVKADTTNSVASQMMVTETNSGGGAPSAIRQVSGTIQFHTAGSGTANAVFDSERVRITSDGNIGVGEDTPTFAAINSIAANAARGIEIFKHGTDTGSAIKLAGRPGDIGTKHYAQLGFSGANFTSHWATYNTSGTKIGEILIGNTGNIGIGDRTSAPDADLHVHTASGESTIHVEGATNANLNLRSHSGDSTVKFSDGSASNVGNINYDHATDSLSVRVNASPRLTIDSSGHALFSGVTSNVDTRNVAGITVKSPGGISLKSFGANGSRNWRIRPDDLNGWADLDFSCAPTDGSTDIPDVATDAVLSLQGDTKDVVVSNGNLKIGTSGKGIDFHNYATSGNPSSNLLDDYEEGTWTPVAAKYSGGAISCTYAQQIGNYTKIGRLVTVEFGIQISALSSQGSNLNYIANLPYVPVASYRASGSLTRNSALNVNYANTCNVHADFGGVIYLSQATQTTAILNVAWQVGYLNGSITYITAS